MAQTLTPEQYRRANKTAMWILNAIYILFIVVEINSYGKAVIGIPLIRIGVYLFSIILNQILVRVFLNKKRSMIIMAINAIMLYGVLVMFNGPGAMAMCFVKIHNPTSFRFAVQVYHTQRQVSRDWIIIQ